ncbi:MAG: hypothetical protein BECKG1743D_GA0114223_100552 [Candidatus Kentron sp. G]|nr:MAG: hypothetical protein BECKG1743F_GA0114225_100522 [Candidatus Kentron sp. G]VFM96391.1 MAG: hypothetical protein BECKG1743E_GA0114224_100561 [Candidatus Kentron sp. G]VFM98308.1 MAG: hypothetical protein BECKG1743D_GA0114223_100552 [Candidatus Kentron sp. G]
MEVNEHFEHIFNAVRECEATFAYSSMNSTLIKLNQLPKIPPLEEYNSRI